MMREEEVLCKAIEFVHIKNRKSSSPEICARTGDRCPFEAIDALCSLGGEDSMGALAEP